jgi:tetratricopeptide (TPR) repeat protein
MILAQAGQSEECVKAIQTAMKFPEAQSFGPLLQYADILEKCGRKNAAVQAINLALPLVDTAQPASILAAAELLLKIDSVTYAPHVVSRLLQPLQRRSSIGWQDVARMGDLFSRCNDFVSAQKCFAGYARATGNADAYLQLALVSAQANMLKEAREAMSVAWQIDPARMRSIIGKEPWKSLYQQLRP